MKTITALASLLVFSQMVFSQGAWAQEESVSSSVDNVEAVPHYSLGNKFIFSGQGLSNDSKTEKGSYEVGVGYQILEKLQVGISYGQISAEKNTSGGDLSDWQYVERKMSLSGNYETIDVRYSLWQTESKRHEIFVDGSYGFLQANVSADYNRYKPYNGAICLFGGCDKALEESTNDSGKISTRFARYGGGYAWTFARDNSVSAYKVFLGLHSFQLLEAKNLSVDSAHPIEVGTDLLGSSQVSLGVSAQF